MTKKLIDNKTTWATFALDLRKNCTWSGAIEYGAQRIGRRREQTFEPNRVAAIQLTAPLGYTCSQKINVGAPVSLIIYIKHEIEDSEFIGYADKRKGALTSVVWMQGKDAMFFHQILMSGQYEKIEITGTDLYRSKASIRRIGISGKYDLDD